MKTLIQLSLGLMLIGPFSFAQTESPIIAANEDRSCAPILRDQFDVGWRATDASRMYPGYCMDGHLYRAAKVIREDEDEIVVANVRHDNQYWVAVIPKLNGAFSHANFQIIRFPVVEGVEAAHAQIRFVMRKALPIRLENQLNRNQVEYIGSLIYSVEAAMPRKQAFNFAMGALQNYPIVGRLTSSEQRLLESGASPIEQYRLNLTSNEVRQVALQSILRSDQLGLRYFYNTLKPNCTTEVFDQIDTLPRFTVKPRPFYTVLWVDPITGPSLQALRNRGVLIARTNDLGDEVAGRKTSPQILSKSQTPSVIRTAPNMPFTSVQLIPKTPDSLRVMQLVHKEMNQTLSALGPKLAQAAIVPALTGSGVAGAVVKTVIEIQRELQLVLRRMNPNLPEHPVYYSVYFTPWSPGAPQATLVPFGINGDLPFADSMFRETAPEVTSNVLRGVHNFQKKFQNREFDRLGTRPVFFMGSLIRFKFQKNKSEVVMQTNVNLIPQNLPFQTYSTQVNLNRITFQQPNVNWLYASQAGNPDTLKGTAIMTHRQMYNEMLNPEVRFEFGGLAALNDDVKSDEFGLFKAYRENLGCKSSSEVVPELRGVTTKTIASSVSVNFLNAFFNKKAIEVGNSVFGERQVALGIYSFKISYPEVMCSVRSRLNKKDQELCALADKSESGVVMSDIDVRVRLGPYVKENKPFGNGEFVRCIRLPFITDEFTREANASIDYQAQELIRKNKDQLIDTIFGGIPKEARPIVEDLIRRR